MNPEILLFIILQVVNVILSTIKSIVMIRGNKWATIIANTIYFGIYTAVIKQVASHPSKYGFSPTSFMD